PPGLKWKPLALSGAGWGDIAGGNPYSLLGNGCDMRGWVPEAAGEKPVVRAVLEHYGARLGQRNSQMVQCVFTEVHADETPSMSVNLGKGLYKCHSCGAGGDSLSLIMEKEGVSYSGAVAFAASHGFATEDAGSGSQPVSGGRFGRAGRVPSRPRRRGEHRPYRPSWTSP